MFSVIFRTILDHHAPLKTKRIRGNQAKFMTKELSKPIMNRSRFKKRYLKWPSRENFLAFEKAENLCNSLNKKAKKTYFEKATEKGIMGSKKCWKHPTMLGTLASRISEIEIVATTTDNFKNHPSIISIKNKFPPTAELNIKAATVNQMNKIIRSLDSKKAKGPDKIPVKVVKMSSYIIDLRLTTIINNDLLTNSSPDSFDSSENVLKRRENRNKKLQTS